MADLSDSEREALSDAKHEHRNEAFVRGYAAPRLGDFEAGWLAHRAWAESTQTGTSAEMIEYITLESALAQLVDAISMPHGKRSESEYMRQCVKRKKVTAALDVARAALAKSSREATDGQVERAAAALWEITHSHVTHRADYNRTSERERTRYRLRARAALSAARETGA